MAVMRSVVSSGELRSVAREEKGGGQAAALSEGTFRSVKLRGLSAPKRTH